MSVFLSAWPSVGFRAVVGGEDDKGIFIEPISFQRVEDLSGDPVGLHHEIAIAAGLRFAEKFVIGNDRGMRRRKSEVEEERLVGFLLIDPRHGALG